MNLPRKFIYTFLACRAFSELVNVEELIFRTALNLIRHHKRWISWLARRECILYSHHGHKRILLSAELCRRRYTYLERYPLKFPFSQVLANAMLGYISGRSRGCGGERTARSAISNSKMLWDYSANDFGKKFPFSISIRVTSSIESFSRSHKWHCTI